MSAVHGWNRFIRFLALGVLWLVTVNGAVDSSAFAQRLPAAPPYGRDPNSWAPPETWLIPGNGGQSSNWLPLPLPSGGSISMPIPDESLERQYASLGLSLVFQSGKSPRVSDILIGSTAESADLRIDDLIVLVNGRSAAENHEALNSSSFSTTSIRYWRAGKLGLINLPPVAPEFCYYSNAKVALLKTEEGIKVVASQGNSLLRTGDRIKLVAGQPVQSIAQFNQQLQRLTGPTQIVYTRAGTTNEITGTLAPANFRDFLGTSLLRADAVGLSAENYFEFLRINVAPGSVASNLGLVTGDHLTHVNGRAIREIQNLGGELSNLQTAIVQRRGTTVQLGPRGTVNRTPTFDFEIRNFTDSTINLFRRRPGPRNGLEEYVQSLAPQQSARVTTSEGQSWAARESQSGITLSEFSTRADDPQLILAPESEVFDQSAFGLSGQVIPRLGFLVIDVVAGSDAARLGIDIGDVIQAVNGGRANRYFGSGLSLDRDSILRLLPNGQSPPIEIGIPILEEFFNPAGPDSFALPDWVLQGNRGNVGGIQVVRTEPGQSPPVAALLAAYYISAEAGEYLKLADVPYFGTQIVAGTNHYFVCQMENPQTGESSFWNVGLFIDLDGRPQLNRVERLR